MKKHSKLLLLSSSILLAGCAFNAKVNLFDLITGGSGSLFKIESFNDSLSEVFQSTSYKRIYAKQKKVNKNLLFGKEWTCKEETDDNTIFYNTKIKFFPNGSFIEKGLMTYPVNGKELSYRLTNGKGKWHIEEGVLYIKPSKQYFDSIKKAHSSKVASNIRTNPKLKNIDDKVFYKLKSAYDPKHIVARDIVNLTPGLLINEYYALSDNIKDAFRFYRTIKKNPKEKNKFLDIIIRNLAKEGTKITREELETKLMMHKGFDSSNTVCSQ